uniref:GRAM domain-containing protein 1B isoform X8 n=1 Tax=Monopterus albus TaxID=43700 RepID=UPI0009B4D725|nr:GRAM domain-containing protein 1B isoform X8 [Monopterus albus]
MGFLAVRLFAVLVIASEGCLQQLQGEQRSVAGYRGHGMSCLLCRSDSAADKIGTASNSNKSTPTCSPVLRKRSRSPTPQSQEGENMVEKGSDHSSDKSPSTPEQIVQRTYSLQSTRGGGKNSKKSQSWYNHERQHILRVLSPTYKQRNEDFRKLFKQLPDTERLIVDYSCALQRDILLQGRLYLSENWICFYSNIFRWETLLTVRLIKDICSMKKEKTARLIPNAIQVCTDTEKHFFTSFGARDRTYMMMFRLWQNALLDKPLCPKELWHFVHQCYGNELGLTSDDEDYVPPDDDFNTMGFSEEIPNEENEINNDNLSKSTAEAKSEGSPPLLHKKVIPNNTIPTSGNHDTPITFDLPAEEFADCLPDSQLLAVPLVVEEKNSDTSGPGGPVPSPSLDLNDNEDIPTELSDSSETHDEGEVQAFHEDLNGRQHINEVYKFSVDKLYDILFTESQFMSDFMEQRRFTDVVYRPWKKEEAGNQTREIMYTISLSNPLAPKTATVTETQTLYKASQESECYIIDAEVITHDVPYHDYFYTLNRYMLTRVAKNQCRLRVSTELRYRKQPWGLVKGFIEKNFWSGLEENFRLLETLHLNYTELELQVAMNRLIKDCCVMFFTETWLDSSIPDAAIELVGHTVHRHDRNGDSELELSKLEEILNESHRLSPKTKVVKNATVRRKKRPLPHMRSQHLDEALSPVTTPTDEEVIQRIKQVAGSTQTRFQSSEIHYLPGGLALYSVSKLLLIISFVICLSLVLLVFLNMILFYKLWMLEYSTQSLTTWQGLRLHESKLPETQMEWAQLLEAQQRYHDAELQKWKEIIKSSVVLLDQMKDSLLNLQRGIGLRDYTPETEEKRSRYH